MPVPPSPSLKIKARVYPRDEGVGPPIHRVTERWGHFGHRHSFSRNFLTRCILTCTPAILCHALGMKLISLIVAALLSTAAIAGTTPYSDQLESALNINGANLVPGGEGLGLEKIAVASWDAAVEGGTSSTTVKNLGVSLPAKALVLRWEALVDTAFTQSGTSLIRFLCGSTLIDTTYRNYATLGAAGTAASTTIVDCGTSSAALGIRLQDASPTAGRVTWFVHYVTHY